MEHHINKDYNHLLDIKEKHKLDCSTCQIGKLRGGDLFESIALTIEQHSEFKKNHKFNFIYKFFEKCKFFCKTCKHLEYMPNILLKNIEYGLENQTMIFTSLNSSN
jgi:hypothetical protein